MNRNPVPLILALVAAFVVLFFLLADEYDSSPSACKQKMEYFQDDRGLCYAQCSGVYFMGLAHIPCPQANDAVWDGFPQEKPVQFAQSEDVEK